MKLFAPSRTFLRPDELGALAAKLGGSISPCCSVRFRGLDLLFAVVASGIRHEDDGPAWRRLIVIHVEGGRVADWNVAVEHFPNKGKPQDDEEGAFSAAAIPAGDALELYVGEILWTSPGSVDVRTTLYRTRDLTTFERIRVITAIEGVEVGPVAAYGRHVFEFYKQRFGWQTWQLGIDGEQVRPTILTTGASGPFDAEGGLLELNVVRHNGFAGPSNRLLVPHSEWWLFDPDDPRDFTFAGGGMLARAIAPDQSVAYALDSQHMDAEILELRPIEDPGFLERARPYRLVSDPRLWRPTAVVTALRWRGGNLELEWDGVAEWGFHTRNTENRAIYGNIIFGFVVDGEPVITTVEYLANRRGAPHEVVDTVFEDLGHENNELALGKVLERGEELYICAASPCRPEGTAGYPREVGLQPQRTRWIRARFLEDGFEDVEPSGWWQGTTPEPPEEGDDVYLRSRYKSYEFELPVEPGEGTHRTPIDLPVPLAIRGIFFDFRPGGFHGSAKVNIRGAGDELAWAHSNAVVTSAHGEWPLVEKLMFVANGDPGSEGGNVRVIIAGRIVDEP